MPYAAAQSLGSPPNCLPILPEIRSAAVVGESCFSRRGLNYLHAPNIRATNGSHRVPHGGERWPNQVIDRRLQAQAVRNLAVSKSRHIRRGLHVRPEVEYIDE